MTQIQRRLFALQDTTYRDFSAALIPGISKDRVIGVRTPQIRALAKDIFGTDQAEEFLKQLPHRYYEENNLHAFLLEKITDRTVLLQNMELFLPWVDNWATCDSFSPKLFQNQPPEMARIDAWLQSGHTYTVRFGILCLMRYYLDERFQIEYAQKVGKVQSEEYYIRMMQSWYFATALSKQWERVLPFLTHGYLEPWTRNKAIQKAMESRRITPEQKAYLKSIKK